MLDKQLLKVWGWFFQWVPVGGKASPKGAQLFAVPVDRSLPLQRLSGVGGLYVEPRDVSGREANPDFRVLWMSQASRSAVEVACKSHDKITICHLHEEFGVRVKALLPSKVFVDC